MEIRQNRREFVKLAGLSAAALGTGKVAVAAAGKPRRKGKIPFKLGMASYTFRKFPTDKTIQMTNRLGLKYIEFKSMHMPLESSCEQIKKIAAMVRDAGLVLYSASVVYINNPRELDRAFEYAKCAGLEMLTAVPKHQLLELVDAKVKQYDVKVAIHNHGPGDELYPTPASVYEKVKGLDKRIGLCIDIGHTVRSGLDPAVEVTEYADRLYDMHIKDVDKAAAEGKTVEMGRGVIDIPKLFRTLIRAGYSHVASFEFEKDPTDPLPGVAESVGYTKGVLAVI